MSSFCRLFFRTKLLVTLTALLLLLLLTGINWRSTPPSRRFVKATISHPSSSRIQNDVLTLHNAQNARFGYKTHTLRVTIVKGNGDLFYFLLSLLS
jgi:hypothetical protein